jgi:hypothetical protein
LSFFDFPFAFSNIYLHLYHSILIGKTNNLSVTRLIGPIS